MEQEQSNGVGRRDFFKAATAGVTTAAVLLSPRDAVQAQEAAQKAALERIASNCWPVRPLFKSRPMPPRPAGAGGPGGGQGRGQGPGIPADVEANPNAKKALEVARAAQAARAKLPDTAGMKKKYGEITMLDFPAFTKEHFPGVTRMDLFSGVFGDVTDDAQFFPAGENGRPGGFDPMAPASRKWLDTLANTCVKQGTAVQHISNNAPGNLADYGSPEADARRQAGVDLAKRWLEGCRVLGVKSMRMNSTSALGPGIRPNAVPRGRPSLRQALLVAEELRLVVRQRAAEHLPVEGCRGQRGATAERPHADALVADIMDHVDRHVLAHDEVDLLVVERQDQSQRVDEAAGLAVAAGGEVQVGLGDI